MNRINELRKSNGFSQQKLAEILNVHQTAISQWETSRTTPDIELASKMAQIFGVSLEYLLGKDETYSEPSSPRRELYDLIEKMDESEISELENYVDFILSKKKK